MSTSPAVTQQDVLRFYERVNRVKPAYATETKRTATHPLIEISAEAKKKLIMEMARSEVLERIRS